MTPADRPATEPREPWRPRYGDLIDEYGERAVNEIRERALSQEQRVIVHHGDPDSYARAYNEGYADATRHLAEAAQGAAPLDGHGHNEPLNGLFCEGAAPLDPLYKTWTDPDAEVMAREDRADLREQLAALEHEQWEKWSRTVAEQGLTPERIERWERYWVPFADLDEATKDFDREWADKALALIEGAAPRAEGLDVDTLLAAERVVQGWDDDLTDGGMTALILDLQQALERRVRALSRPSDERVPEEEPR